MGSDPARRSAGPVDFSTEAQRGETEGSFRGRRRSLLQARPRGRRCAIRNNRPRGRSQRPRGDEFESSTLRAGRAALADVVAILVERHRGGRVTVELRTATLDLRVPRFRGVVVRFAVETADQLARQARTLLGRQAKYIREKVARSHAQY